MNQFDIHKQVSLPPFSASDRRHLRERHRRATVDGTSLQRVIERTLILKYNELKISIAFCYRVEWEAALDFRQLRYFTILAEQGHFGRAAAALHIAQPALSRQIRLLEEELGVQLFERHPRGAAPTEAAVVLLDRATFILRYFEQLRSDVAATQRDPHGPVALGMSPGLALTLALPLYDEISSRFPGVQLQIVEDFTDTLHDRLLRGTIDLAILNGPRSERPNLVTTPLMEEQICLIGVANSPHLRRAAVDVQDLPKIPLVLAGVAKSGVREVVETAATKAGIKLEPKVEVQSLEVAKRIISQGILCTAHFAAPIKDDIDSGRFRAVPIKGLFLTRFIARASDRPPSRATAVLTQLVQDVSRQLVSRARWPNAKLREELKGRRSKP
jgi:LysR family transcriptional regulator, nitrogen assimilation regulatory protein